MNGLKQIFQIFNICGESAELTWTVLKNGKENSMRYWKIPFQKSVYNADKIGQFYHAMPNKDVLH